MISGTLRGTADKIDAANANYVATGWSSTHGFGRVNAGAAVRLAQTLAIGWTI
jgi:hypothetical protein